jgi:hypothetical protein
VSRRANSVKVRARVAATFEVDFDRVCDRASRPISGAGRDSKADSETHVMLPLLSQGDFLLRSDRLLGLDPGHMRAVQYIVTERRRQSP